MFIVNKDYQRTTLMKRWRKVKLEVTGYISYRMPVKCLQCVNEMRFATTLVHFTDELFCVAFSNRIFDSLQNRRKNSA